MVELITLKSYDHLIGRDEVCQPFLGRMCVHHCVQIIVLILRGDICIIVYIDLLWLRVTLSVLLWSQVVGVLMKLVDLKVLVVDLKYRYTDKVGCSGSLL